MANILLSASGQSIETLQKRIAASGHSASFELPNTRWRVRTTGIVSDYVSFTQAEVPCIYLADPLHDDYHQTGDSVEKVSGEWLAKVTRLASLTLLGLAYR